MPIVWVVVLKFEYMLVHLRGFYVCKDLELGLMCIKPEVVEDWGRSLVVVPIGLLDKRIIKAVSIGDGISLYVKCLGNLVVDCLPNPYPCVVTRKGK